MSDLEFKHAQDIARLDRKTKYLEQQLSDLSNNYVKFTEATDSTLNTIVDNVSNMSVNNIASLQAVQEDMVSRLMIMAEMSLAALPSEKAAIIMEHARRRMQALPDTGQLALKHKRDIQAQADAAEDAMRRNPPPCPPEK